MDSTHAMVLLLAYGDLYPVSFRMPETSINVVLVAPEIPQNTGAVGRVCVGLGARLHLIEPLAFSLDSSYVKRCGLDYWKHVLLTVHPDWDSFLATEQPGKLAFLSTKTERSFYGATLTQDTYLVFGNETTGLPEEFYDRYREYLYHLPMPGPHARAINLANAVSVAAYEMYRQLCST